MDKDGFKFFIPPLLVSAILYVWFLNSNSFILLYLAFALFVLSLLLLLFFRDPERKIPEGDDIIVSPVDGKVINTEENPGHGKKLSIFLSIFDVHINRMPISGKVVDIRKKRGAYLPAYKEKAEKENSAIETDVQTPYGLVTVRQVVGILARRLVNRLNIGDEVVKGQRFGLMRFGSRLDLILPENTRLQTSSGRRVRGGSQVIGRFTGA
ncbi:MAG: phosphatidylserine decarboxylase family protein [candidate division Zixibacteria bacterium]|nr:phosphatidylserine decarboxylase family protein [candidate division Zixibacteria bacterium]